VRCRVERWRGGEVRSVSSAGPSNRSCGFPASGSPTAFTGSLLKTVMGTNPVESMIEIVLEHARNVKRWQDGVMRLRWAAAGMLAAAGQFRRVKGYRQLPQLARALRHAVGADDPPSVAVTA
jgi:hypothetical protein